MANWVLCEELRAAIGVLPGKRPAETLPDGPERVSCTQPPSSAVAVPEKRVDYKNKHRKFNCMDPMGLKNSE
jgi:hypothetical protein